MSKAIESLFLNELTNIGIGYALLNTERNLIQASPSFLNALRVDLEQVLGKKWLTFLQKKLPESTLETIERWIFRKFKDNINEFYFADYVTEFNVQKHLVRLQNYAIDNINYTLMTIKTISVPISTDDFTNTLKGSNDLKIARRIQKAINYNTIDHLEGKYLIYEFDSLFYPSSFLSGDIINMQQIDRRYFSMFIGDGRGHGVSSALFSSLIHSYTNMMSANIRRHTSDVGTLMRKVNNLAYRDFTNTGEHYFFSCIFGIVDGNDRTLHLCNAGHPPAYVIYDKEIISLQPNGPLLGIIPHENFSHTTLELKHAQAFIFFTDGLYDLPPVNADKTNNERTRDWLSELYAETNYHTRNFINLVIKDIKNAKSEARIHDDLSILTMIINEKP
ncbi:MAG: PP2C family protein-serine/threonine phosphatase [Leptospirales bacterium]